MSVTKVQGHKLLSLKAASEDEQVEDEVNRLKGSNPLNDSQP